MDRISVLGMKFKLVGEGIPTGTQLDFKAKDKENKDFQLSDVKGKKVISIFPALNTKVCDAQTLQIARLSKEYKNVTFISVTEDPVEVINEWCAAHGLDNVIIVSDKEYGDFAKKTNLLVKRFKRLARGLIMLDENNKIIDQAFNQEQSVEPDYRVIKKYFN